MTDSDILYKYPEFRPNLTPRQIFEQGAFGGTYWRPITSSITGKKYANQHKKYKSLANIPLNLMTRSEEDITLNKFKIHSGSSLEEWESKGWIVAQDPYGWIQWYCEFYEGRRSKDDERQIKRWLAYAGPHGRFRLRLIGLCKESNTSISNTKISPTIRQGLHQWAYELR